MKRRTRIYTVGHSSQTFERFLALLNKHSITAVADVRSAPFSRHTPHFSREQLQPALEEAGVAYVFLGRELGARSQDNSCYVDNTVSYEKLARTALFRQGIERVEKGAEKFRISLMCSEREPTECHRTILVSKALSERGSEVQHILGDGRIEHHNETMLRVLDILGMPRNDMLHTRNELIEQAYRGREKQIAYRRKG
jgi:uncharacterized protein (DUF488 family)